MSSAGRLDLGCAPNFFFCLNNITLLILILDLNLSLARTLNWAQPKDTVLCRDKMVNSGSKRRGARPSPQSHPPDPPLRPQLSSPLCSRSPRARSQQTQGYRRRRSRRSAILSTAAALRDGEGVLRGGVLDPGDRPGPRPPRLPPPGQLLLPRAE
jgi:hypothetical protein